MPYSRLLRNIVADSGYNAKQIIDECNKKGKKIDKAYISKLLNNKIPPPSEEVSRVIANVCNADERLLVLEGYIDKAPKEVKEIFNSIRYMTTISALNVFSNKVDKSVLEELEKEMNEEPISEFLVSFIDNKANNINIKDSGMELSVVNDDSLKLSLTEPMSLQVKDSSMSPMIPGGAKISLKIEDEYKNGDILAIKVKKQEDFIVRYALFNKDTITLTSLNPKDFEPLTYSVKDIIILGKVERVIIEIN